MNLKAKIGRFGQDLAREYLTRKGYLILAENFYCQAGELDLIAQKDDQLVFIEVKTRRSRKFGLPEEAVNRTKREKMHKAALVYLAQEKIKNNIFRFDCLALEIDKEAKTAKIRHHKAI